MLEISNGFSSHDELLRAAGAEHVGALHPHETSAGRVSIAHKTPDGAWRERSRTRRTLLDNAEREGWRVVEVIVDNGYSGATRDRPGISRIMQRAESGEIDTVVAIKRDRFFRSRLYRLLMDEDLKEHSVRLVALNDTNNRIGDGVQDDFAEWEREQIRERTRLGKLQKARQGKVVGGHNRAAGYDWVLDHNGKTVGYAINEPEMAVVRRTFSEIASGTSGVCAMKEKLDAERVPTPGGGKAWSRPTIRAVIHDDLYKPHTANELQELGVYESVLETLEAGKPYGIYRYESIPVPVPDAGIPREVVEAARHRILSNRTMRESRADNRTWELSGGILRCADCGRAMQCLTVPRGYRTYHYYRCQGRTNGSTDRCGMRTHVRADLIEQEVWEAISSFLDDKQYVLRKIQEHFAQRRKELSRPGSDAPALANQLQRIEAKKVKYQQTYAADAMPLADLAARTAELESEREARQRELERVVHREEELEILAEEEAEIRRRIEGGHYDLKNMTPEKRRELYQDSRLRVEVGDDRRPYISGIFPVRVGGITGTLLRTPDQRGFLGTQEPLPLTEPGHVSKKVTSSSRVVGIIHRP